MEKNLHLKQGQNAFNKLLKTVYCKVPEFMALH